MNAYPKVVQNIHHEFMTAGDILLAEAEGIIKNAPAAAIDKAERLKRVGFGNAKEVHAQNTLKATLEETRKVASLIQTYKERYPDNKFINLEAVNSICSRYNLLCGPINTFTGFVPEVKLAQIEAFRLVSLDKIEVAKIKKITFTRADQEKDGVKAVRAYLESHKNTIDYDELEGRSVDSFLACVVGRTGRTHDTSFRLEYEIQESQMVICAPKKDFRMSGMMKIGNFLQELSFEATVELQDPVVLQPVRGGFLVVAAWGDEASDPLIANDRDN
jgi:hypothetical protein